MQLCQALGVDQLDRHAHELRHRRALAELLDPIARRGEAHAAAGVITDCPAAVGVELLVQLDRVPQQPHQVVARVELRAEARRMPRGAARQLRLLEEDDVVPAEFRQVIREAAAGDSASDDRDPGVLDGGQRASSYRGATRPSASQQRSPASAAY